MVVAIYLKRYICMMWIACFWVPTLFHLVFIIFKMFGCCGCLKGSCPADEPNNCSAYFFSFNAVRSNKCDIKMCNFCHGIEITTTIRQHKRSHRRELLKEGGRYAKAEKINDLHLEKHLTFKKKCENVKFMLYKHLLVFCFNHFVH